METAIAAGNNCPIINEFAATSPYGGFYQDGVHPTASLTPYMASAAYSALTAAAPSTPTAPGAVTATAGAGGAQEVTITVHGGYEPAEVKVRQGQPVRLIFDRQEDSSCSEEVVIPEFGIRKFLPAFQKTPVELTPGKAGAFDITCGMSMLHGKLIVEG